MNIHPLNQHVSVINDCIEVPDLGHLAVNSFVLHATEPVVVDTGLSLPGRGFMKSLGSILDPSDVRWICITHPDRDHVGSLFQLLEAAPRAKVVITFMGAGILSTERPLPRDRVMLVDVGQTFDVGDRALTAFRPPLYDSPATVGFFDRRSGACFTSDCFGAPLPTHEQAACDDVDAVPQEQLRDAQSLWAGIDAPWLHLTNVDAFRRTLHQLRAMSPSAILSSHLPPAMGRTLDFLETLALSAQREAVEFAGDCAAARSREERAHAAHSAVR